MLDNRAVAVIQHAVALGAQLEVRGVLRGLVFVGEVTKDGIALPDIAGMVRFNGNVRKKKPKEHSQGMAVRYHISTPVSLSVRVGMQCIGLMASGKGN